MFFADSPAEILDETPCAMQSEASNDRDALAETTKKPLPNDKGFPGPASQAPFTPTPGAARANGF
jgi:hypothetical protein